MVIDIKYWADGDVTITYRFTKGEIIFLKPIKLVEELLNRELKVGNYQVAKCDEGTSSYGTTTIWFICGLIDFDKNYPYIAAAPSEWKIANVPFAILSKFQLDYTIESHEHMDYPSAAIDHFVLRCEDNAPPF